MLTSSSAYCTSILTDFEFMSLHQAYIIIGYTTTTIIATVLLQYFS